MSELATPSTPSASTPPRRAWPFILTGLLALLVVAGSAFYAYSVLNKKEAPPAPPVQAKVVEPPKPVEPDVSLEKAESDAKALLGSLSPELFKFVDGADLLRRFVAAVNLASNGDAWFHLFPGLHPKGEFETLKRGKQLFISPKSYDRYDVLVHAVTAVDAKRAAEGYKALHPAFSMLFREIAPKDAEFDDAVKKALKPVLEAQVADGDVEVVERGLVYVFKDPAREAEGASAKLLSRMGPQNARALQSELQSFAEAAGLQ